MEDRKCGTCASGGISYELECWFCFMHDIYSLDTNPLNAACSYWSKRIQNVTGIITNNQEGSEGSNE